jgi:glyoxylase-like metal-dependent hydrolase (beta-lactamase superfamily II)/rhodanese-related sulfurtransferase
MILETIETGGCRSYLIGCPDTLLGAVIDPEFRQADRYQALATHHGLHIRYVIDTHTHADHFSGGPALARHFGAPLVVHRLSPTPHAGLRLDDGDSLKLGSITLRALHTPGHTADSMSLHTPGHVFTGDTLLIGGTGRSDLPTGNADALYDSLFTRLLALPDETEVHPAHEYKGRAGTTIGAERTTNPRLQKSDRAAFIAMMEALDLAAPTHLTEALRVNLSGARSVEQLIADTAAALPFIAAADLAPLARRSNDLVLLDVREERAFAAGHIPASIHLPRGQLELRVDEVLPDPTVRIVTVCEAGKISILAAQTLRDLGFGRVSVLEGGIAAWRAASLPVEASA